MKKSKKKSKKIFIDGGAHMGNSTSLFINKYPSSHEYKIYSFEPNYLCKGGVGPNVTLYRNAIWIADGKGEFYINRKKTPLFQDGSSLIKSKQTGGLTKHNPLEVKTIDFSKWIMDTFDKDDYIILKLDIEGAEYKVIEKMFEDGSIEYIDKFYAEWHWNKIGMDKKEHDALMEKLKEIDLSPIFWDARKRKIGDL